MTPEKLLSLFTLAVEFSHRQGWSATESAVKLQTEVGELGDKVLYTAGLTPFKDMDDEPAMGEIADVLNGAIQVAAMLHSDLSPIQLVELLCQYMARKLNKWNIILDQEGR